MSKPDLSDVTGIGTSERAAAVRLAVERAVDAMLAGYSTSVQLPREIMRAVRRYAVAEGVVGQARLDVEHAPATAPETLREQLVGQLRAAELELAAAGAAAQKVMSAFGLRGALGAALTPAGGRKLD